MVTRFLRGYLAAVLGGGVLLLCASQQAVAQYCQPYWTEAYKRMNGCGSSNQPTQTYIPPPPPSPEQIAAQQAYALNQQGTTAYDAGNWAAAEVLFKQVLEKTPNNAVSLRNLAMAQYHQGRSAYEQGNYTVALNYLQQGLKNCPATDSQCIQALGEDVSAAQNKIAEAQRAQAKLEQDKIAAANMQQGIQTLAQSLSAAPSSDGLDFQSASAKGAFHTTSNPTHPDLDFSSGPEPVSVHSVADQLSSAAKSGGAAHRHQRELAKTESDCGFDTSTCANPDPISTHAARSIGQTPGAADLAAHLGSAARDDAQIQQSMAYYQKLDSRKIDAQQKLAAIKQMIASHDGDAKVLGAQQATLNHQLSDYKAQETKTQEQIKKRTVAIHVPWIETPATTAAK